MTPEEQAEYDRMMAWRALTPEQQSAAVDAQWADYRARHPDDIGLRLAMEAELCPCGSGSCGCGSGPPRICSHPDHPPKVRSADCLQCRARQWWDPA